MRTLFHWRTIHSIAWAGLITAGAGRAAADEMQPHGGMMRYPDISATQIVFAYANDLWLAPRDGGTAVPLASPPGEELYPRFSPDGKTIAFVGNYDGNRDLYTVPITGGVPQRVTHHPAAEALCDWTPDGKLIFFTNGLGGNTRQRLLYTVAASGGLPEQLPVPYGANASISADGEWLAYTPHTIDIRTWKRYRGGMATDVWLFNLKSHESKKITDWEGLDSQPMWHGQKVYYISDAGANHRVDVWSYDTASGERKQITHYKDYDAKWPAMGPGPSGDGEIIMQVGPELRVLDLKTESDRVVNISVPGARPKLRPQLTDVSEQISGMSLAPGAKRAALEARGDIWTAPAQHGSPRNLTHTSGVAERDPAWSPDGKWIAYFSDESGEYELYVRAGDEKGTPRRVTTNGNAYRFMGSWSPDSKWLTFGDKAGRMYLCNVEGGEVKEYDQEPLGNYPGGSWSSDSNWIAYARGGENLQSSIWLYNVTSGEKKQVTSDFFACTSPAFDHKGEFLYYVSTRDFSAPVYDDAGNSFVYSDIQRLMAAPLRTDIASPLAAKSDEEGKKDDAKKDGDKKEDGKKEDGKTESKPADSKPADGDGKSSESKPAEEKKPEPVKIDLDGLEQRAILLPVARGRLGGLSVNDKGQLLYVRATAAGGQPSLKIYDATEDDPKEKTVADGVGGYSMSADGKKLLVRHGNQLVVVDAAADQKLDKPMDLSGLKTEIDPREEWKQIFNEAWRIERDYFYAPNMHGVNWPAVKEQYAKMLPDCTSREDLTFIIKEMISELNVGHAYYYGDDSENGPSVSVGLLGCDFALENGAYRIRKIYEGAAWDADARGPLSQPGVKAKVGDYVLAVNGIPLDAKKDPWAAFQGLADKVVTLTVSENPTRDEKARDIVVRLPGSEGDLRFRAWIEKNRQYVADKTGGAVGYIYVKDTGVEGQNDLFRQFFGQIDKAALIIDERWNGGGQIPTRFIELLNRPRTNYWARRDGKDWPWPPDSHQGPKCMLINGLSGSGGDAFPAYFRMTGLGKLIGTRTWGGLVGISGNPGFIDGTSVTAPTFGYYKKDGTWGIEGHGVDPDIEVIDDPAKMQNGADPQLDRAIAQMQEEIKTKGYHPPQRPAYPDRSGMGVREEDK